MRKALIFDYDGLMIDSETPEYQSWCEVYHQHGAELKISDWLKAVGYVDHFDPRDQLEKLLQKRLEWEPIEKARKERCRILFAEQKILPGVLDVMQRGLKHGYRIGVASNGTSKWVISGLKHLGLADFIHEVKTRDDIRNFKPHPEVYQKVIEALGADPAASFAFEDSQPGITAARMAGLTVVVVPGFLTRHQVLSGGNYILKSLEEFRLPEDLDLI